jgi:hypothetical protein
VTFAFGGQNSNDQRMEALLFNGRDLLKRRIGKGSKYFGFAGLEPSCLVRLQHQF